MADATAPLLPAISTTSAPTYSSSRPTSKTAAPTTVHSIDDAIETYIGSTSAAAQLGPAVLITLACVFDAQQTFISVFADAMPPWHCTTLSCSASPASTSPCDLSPSSWSWSLPRHTSTISTWSLECASPALVALPSASYFTGCLAGGFLLGTLADSRLGRKNTLSLCCLIMSVSAALTAASPSLLVYSILRFISGFGRATISTSVLVLSNELVSRRWRERVSILGFTSVTVGFLSLPAIAYVTRGGSWRTLYLLTAAPALVYTVVIYFALEESPRWLLVVGRRSEAIETIKRLTFGSLNTMISSSFSNLPFVENGGGQDNSSMFGSATMLWKKTWAFWRLSALMTVSIGIGMVYYGMPLNLGNLGSNLYLSVTLNALCEVPSDLLAFFLIGSMNRRSSMLALTTTSGLLCLACAAMGDGNGWVEMGVELTAFFTGCLAFCFLMVYSVELFPTCVRNSAITMVRQATMVGGIFAPLLAAEGRRRSVLSFGSFGLAIGCAGMFVMFLPETRGKGISDTMEEEEEEESNQVVCTRL